MAVEHLKQEGPCELVDPDIPAAMKQKINADIAPHHFPGACDLQRAHQALVAGPEIGALLSCNVVVRSEGDETVASFMDPQAMTRLNSNPQVHAMAGEAEARIRRVCTALGAVARRTA